jgi:hypothetical protein
MDAPAPAGRLTLAAPAPAVEFRHLAALRVQVTGTWCNLTCVGRDLVNVGVLGRPENDGTPRVWCTLLTAEPGREPAVEFVPLAYDHEALAGEMEAERARGRF